MILDDATIDRLANQYFEAERQRTTLPPVSQEFPEMTLDDAYEVQAAYVALKQASGLTPGGIKVGSTSEPVQKRYGVSEPVCSVMFAERATPTGGTIQLAELVHPRLEAEFAFRMAVPLAGPGVTPSDALAAIEVVIPAFEVIDCHTEDWTMGAVELVSDNCVHAGYVLGDPMPYDGSIDLAEVAVRFRRNDESCDGSGAVPLGHPANVLAWLANWLARRGRGLGAGDIVLSGSAACVYEARAGDTFRADFDGLGSVAVSFA
jgi:2-keto-4-pentenoate hydratase